MFCYYASSLEFEFYRYAFVVGQFPQPHGRLNNNNTQITGASNGHSHVGPPVTLPKTERRRTVSFRKGMDPREELLRRSTTPDIKEVMSLIFVRQDGLEKHSTELISDYRQYHHMSR